LDLLPDPAQAALPSSEYVISAPFYKYPRDWILNHRVDSQDKLGLGDNISGMLIFGGVEPIPADLCHGSLVEVGLNVVLQGGQSFATTCLMTVDKGFEGRVIQPPGQISSEAPPRSCEQSVKHRVCWVVVQF
jgi:hypothetical protein